MPLFKQVTAQQKRSKRKAEALLSDEEGNDSSSDEELLDSDSGESGSGSDESDSEVEGDEDEELLGPEEDDDEEPQVLDEDEPRPPPAGFPTAKAALENTVASTAALIAEMDAEKGEDGKTEEDDEEEAPLVCVVCPNKILKPGKMVEVHLASKVSLDPRPVVCEADTDARFVFPRSLRNRITSVASTDSRFTSNHQSSSSITSTLMLVGSLPNSTRPFSHDFLLKPNSEARKPLQLPPLPPQRPTNPLLLPPLLPLTSPFPLHRHPRRRTSQRNLLRP